ncbi:gibberellin A4 carboxyl methyltransferase, partial [Sarracenia purpurea var. burkii]
MSSNAVMESKAFPMNGGNGTYSYTKNSQFQRAASNVAKEMIKEEILEKFDIAALSSSSNTIRIADLGCSVGPNTLLAMQNVIEAMEKKMSQYSQDFTFNLPEFQLFFNDHTSNDFNTLFTSLPPNRHYFAAGVPGSFHGRLFPMSSLHFVYSSIALQWLSKVPEELLDKSSHPQNRRRIHYMSADLNNITEAYAAQFAKDMGNFFNARGDEIASGGMMIIILPAIPDGVHHSQAVASVTFSSLEQSLIEMVEAGSISEAKVDSFYLPVYFPSPREMKQLIESNGCFSIERMELTNVKSKIDGP